MHNKADLTFFFQLFGYLRSNALNLKGTKAPLPSKSRNSREVSHDAYWFIISENRQANKQNEETKNPNKKQLDLCDDDTKCRYKILWGSSHLHVGVKAPQGCGCTESFPCPLPAGSSLSESAVRCFPSSCPSVSAVIRASAVYLSYKLRTFSAT